MRRYNNFGRKAAHAEALLMNLSKSLIKHKRIQTTLAKGKALRRFIEPIITKAKNDTTHSRRVVFSYFQDKDPVKELFSSIGPKVLDRPGGYLRIIKTENRSGDNAETCFVEFVDYNDIYSSKISKGSQTKTRRGKKKKEPETAPLNIAE